MYLPPLIEGRLLRRHHRFLADVELLSGERITAHVANTGRMTGLTDPGNRVWLRDSGNHKRKYRYSWVLVETAGGVLAGVDTGHANVLAREAIEQAVFPELAGYRRILPEQRYGEEGSRIDLLLDDGPLPRCYVEVKNVSLVQEGIARFPDAKTERGRKHLRELLRMVKAGHRAAVLFCIQRGDAWAFRAADHIDPDYARTLHEVMKAGVEALAARSRVELDCICLDHPVEVIDG